MSDPLDFFPLLAPDIQLNIVKMLSTQDMATVARVSKSWKTLIESESVWKILLDRDFRGIDSATLSAAECRGSTSREAYILLAKKRICLRCQLDYRDSDNSDTSCKFHSGLLFSGGLMNGTALRFTCCSRRAHQTATGSRDSNGCKSSYHVALSESIWASEGATGACVRSKTASISIASKQRECLKVAAPSSFSGSPIHCSSPRGALEWHPNQRPGLIELPSRLLLSKPA